MTTNDFSPFAQTVVQKRYAIHDGETWPEIAQRVASSVLGAVGSREALIHAATDFIRARKFIPGGRYLANAGRPLHQTGNCLLLRAEDSREGWGNLVDKAMVGLMSGAGVGVDYSALRPSGAALKRSGGIASGPLAAMHAVNECGRAAIAGGSRRAAIWAGLNWRHPDVFAFIRMKDWSEAIRRAKDEDFNTMAPMDHTNISVILDDDFFAAYALGDERARAIYHAAIRRALKTGEPGFSIDVGANRGESLRNACCELTSRDDSDVCNLASINLSRIESIDEMRGVVEVATAFLLAGTVYSDVPYEKVRQVREKNRRLGLGLMGLHEAMLQAGHQYRPNQHVEAYLLEYERSDEYAARWADEWGISRPVKTRAVAPTGTIAIVGETTTGVEPIFCAAYKRRYFDRGVWRHQYVLDPTARRFVDRSGDVSALEDAQSLGLETRLEVQAWLQRHVDHAVSSTINLPPWGSPKNCDDTVDYYAATLLPYLPKLRGVTFYPDGARGGQPIVPMDYHDAAKLIGVEHTEAPVDVCELRGGSCGA